MAVHSTCEVLVVGAGPAGLTASIYLARFRRRLRLVDEGLSRARYIPISRNCPGFAHGVSGEGLLAELREQASRHGVAPEPGAVRVIKREGEQFVAELDGPAIRAQRVILATGISDVLPPWAGVEEAVRRGTLRLCAVCDAFETAGRKVGVYGPAAEAVKHAHYLRSFAREVWVLPTEGVVTAPEQAGLRALGIEAVQPRSIRIRGAGLEVESEGGARLALDVLYPFLGARPCSRLAQALGARCDASGYIAADAHQRTSVPGLYAIGDVVSALNQIAVGMGHAAIATAAIHNELPQRAL